MCSSDLFNKVLEFEKLIAEFYGSKYAVSTDCCTHAIELCLRLLNPSYVECPTNTYISIPFTFEKLGISWDFNNDQWHNYYFIGNTHIVDAAVYWQENGYVPNTLMCLSFQFKKHLSLGRGGVILTDNYEAQKELKKMSYDGRISNVPWIEQDIDTIGYHYYMTPETAILGLQKLPEAIKTKPKKWKINDWADLTQMKIFKESK